MTQLHTSTEDLGDALRILRTLLGSPVDLTPDPADGFALSAVASAADGFTFADLTLRFRGRWATESFAGLLLSTTVDGRHRWTVGGRVGDAAAPLVLLPGQDGDGEFDRIRTYTAIIPVAVADELVASWSPGAPPSVSADGRGEPLQALLRHLGATFAAFPSLFDDPLIRTSAQQTLLHVLLGSSTALDPAPPTDRAAPRALLRALAFIDEHAAGPVATAEIAAAARMSVRGLQSMFRRELRTTPIAHLRSVRLDRARAELLAADPYDGVSVASVARRWGFVHLPRFASTYRAAYGELPSQTLRH